MSNVTCNRSVDGELKKSKPEQPHTRRNTPESNLKAKGTSTTTGHQSVVTAYHGRQPRFSQPADDTDWGGQTKKAEQGNEQEGVRHDSTSRATVSAQPAVDSECRARAPAGSTNTSSELRGGHEQEEHQATSRRTEEQRQRNTRRRRTLCGVRGARFHEHQFESLQCNSTL